MRVSGIILNAGCAEVWCGNKIGVEFRAVIIAVTRSVFIIRHISSFSQQLRMILPQPLIYILLQTLCQGVHLLCLVLRDDSRNLIFSLIALLPKSVKHLHGFPIHANRQRKTLHDPVMMGATTSSSIPRREESHLSQLQCRIVRDVETPVRAQALGL